MTGEMDLTADKAVVNGVKQIRLLDNAHCPKITTLLPNGNEITQKFKSKHRKTGKVQKKGKHTSAFYLNSYPH